MTEGRLNYASMDDNAEQQPEHKPEPAGPQIDFEMQNPAVSDFVAETVDQRKWPQELRAAGPEMRELIEQLSDENNDYARMLRHQIDGTDKALGDTALFANAVMRAGQQIGRMVDARTGNVDADGRKRLKFEMPVSGSMRQQLIQEARGVLNKELMQAKAEWIRRTGRPLPGGL